MTGEWTSASGWTYLGGGTFVDKVVAASCRVEDGCIELWYEVEPCRYQAWSFRSTEWTDHLVAEFLALDRSA